MRVFVYVEGPGDRAALEALLRPIVDRGSERGVGIRFLPLGGKAAILNDVGRKAADQIFEKQDDWVIALPDLYPMATFAETRNAHRSFEDLRALLLSRFSERADRLGLPEQLRNQFRVHCLKHDLEALILAAPEVLRQRLRTDDALRNRWRLPVEEQNDEQPPKRIVTDLFAHYRQKPVYGPTIDAPWILARASLDTVKLACPQQFAPFVAELERIINDRAPG